MLSSTKSLQGTFGTVASSVFQLERWTRIF